MIRFGFGVLMLFVFVEPISPTSVINNRIAKRALCPPGTGDTSPGCPLWKIHCTPAPDNKLYDFVRKTCPVTCGVCEARPTPPPVGVVVTVASMDCLRAHNDKRSLHVNTPSFTWDADLANGSQDWSLKLANENSDPVDPVHSNSSKKYGENIKHFGTTGSANKGCQDAVIDWYNEKEFYDWSRPGFSKKAGEDIGHFTQVVWKRSERVGCGAAKITRGYWVHTFITCRYSPRGNIENQYSVNVLPLK